jgi:hypothetical protein
MTRFINISDYIKNKFNNEPGRRAAKLAEEILKKTAHIPVVTTIARGVGFCTYHAKLTEAIGAQSLEGHTIDRACGKGDDIHKILGLSSLKFFTGEIKNIKEIIEESTDELRRHSLIQNESTLEESKIESSKLMNNLLQRIGKFEEITGMKVSDAIPIVEQQLVDYELRMRGIPDLILESRNEQKAIVIDWKTSRETPSKYEAAQVVCYALLESRRLSCTKEEAIEKIAGRLERTKITSVDILPVIIRADPSLALKPHPVFSKPEKLPGDYDEFVKLVSNTILMAQHLTLLLCNQEALTNVKPIETSGPVPWGSGRVNYIRLTPFDIGLYHGDPDTQVKYPCTACYIKDPCKFYYGRPFGEKEKYESLMWKLRYIMFERKEEQLLIYLALHHIFKFWSYNEVVNMIKQGYGLVYSIGSTPWKKSRSPGRIFVKGSNGKEQRYRIDLLDEIITNPTTRPFSIEGKRAIREYEDGGSLRVINEGRPVFIALPNYAHQDISPQLSVNCFGRVDKVDIDKDGRVSYEIGLPSKVLKYQMLIFSNYIINKTLPNKDIIIVEANVDLTRMELYAIDYLHRKLGEEGKDKHEDLRSEIEREVTMLENSRWSGVDSDEIMDVEEYLKEILEVVARKNGLRN